MIKKWSVAQCHEHCVRCLFQAWWGPTVTWAETEYRPDTVLELDDIGCVHKVTQIPFYWMKWLLVCLPVLKNCASDIYLELSGCGVHHQLLFNLRTLHLSGASLISKCWSWSWRMSVSVLCICLFQLLNILVRGVCFVFFEQ